MSLIQRFYAAVDNQIRADQIRRFLYEASEAIHNARKSDIRSGLQADFDFVGFISRLKFLGHPLTIPAKIRRESTCDDAILLIGRNLTMEQLWSKTVPKHRKQGQRQRAKP